MKRRTIPETKYSEDKGGGDRDEEDGGRDQGLGKDRVETSRKASAAKKGHGAEGPA